MEKTAKIISKKIDTVLDLQTLDTSVQHAKKA